MTREPIRKTATPQEQDIFDKLTEDEIVVMFFLVVFLLIGVILMTLVQCRRLKATMVKRRQFKQQQEWRVVSARLGGGVNRNESRTRTMATTNAAQEIRSAHASSRNMNRQSFQSLQSEIQGLRYIHENVHSQVSTLERYVALKTGDSTVTATARTRTPNESSAGSSSRDTQTIRPDETSASLGPRRRHVADT